MQVTTESYVMRIGDPHSTIGIDGPSQGEPGPYEVQMVPKAPMGVGLRKAGQDSERVPNGSPSMLGPAHIQVQSQPALLNKPSGKQI